MELNGKLIKVEDGFYTLINEDGYLLNVKLSVKNCEAIEREYDLDKFFESYMESMSDYTTPDMFNKEDYVAGFQKALEILSDKKFSEEDMMVFFKWADQQMRSYCGKTSVQLLQEWKSLQQRKWDVTYSMRKKNIDELRESKEGFLHNPNLSIYETDSDGCVILKRK